MLALELLMCNITCNLLAFDMLKYPSLTVPYSNVHNLFLAFETRTRGALAAFPVPKDPFHKYIYDWIRSEYRTSLALFNKALKLKDNGYLGSAFIYVTRAFSKIYIASKAFAFLKLKTSTDVGKEVMKYGELLDSIIYTMYRTTISGRCKNTNAILYMAAYSEYVKLNNTLHTLMSPPDILDINYARSLTKALEGVSKILTLGYVAFTLSHQKLEDVMLININGSCPYPHAFSPDLLNDEIACKALTLSGNGLCIALRTKGCAPLAALAIRETFPNLSALFCAVKG